MGGLGSTKWRYHYRKTTVEESLVLSTKDLFRYPIPENDLAQIDWTDRRTGNIIAFMFYQFDQYDPSKRTLFTVVGRKIGDEVKMEEQWIRLVSANCGRYAGTRFYFECPSFADRCNNRRCSKLYLPPGSLTLACRECHDLTYQNSLDGYKIARLRKLSTALLQ